MLLFMYSRRITSQWFMIWQNCNTHKNCWQECCLRLCYQYYVLSKWFLLKSQKIFFTGKNIEIWKFTPSSEFPRNPLLLCHAFHLQLDFINLPITILLGVITQIHPSPFTQPGSTRYPQEFWLCGFHKRPSVGLPRRRMMAGVVAVTSGDVLFLSGILTSAGVNPAAGSLI